MCPHGGGCRCQEHDCSGELRHLAWAQPGMLGQDTGDVGELISLSLGMQTMRRQKAAMSLLTTCWGMWKRMKMTCI